MTKFAPLITYNESTLLGKGGFMKGYGRRFLFIELYLDVLFLMNLCMNYLLLKSVTVLTGKRILRIRSVLGSAIGAFGVCAFVCLPVRLNVANLLPVHVVTSTLMVKIGCKIKDAKNLVYGVVLLYITGFLWGGMFFALYQSQDGIDLLPALLFSVLFYEMTTVCIGIYRYKIKNQERSCEVTLYVKEKSKKVKGLYDTGNLLQDPVCGLPVSVVDATVIRELTDDPPEICEEMRPHYIPFRTVGSDQGVLLAVTIDAMEVVVGDKHCHIDHPVLALAKETVSFTQHYQLILNPSLIDS